MQHAQDLWDAADGTSISHSRTETPGLVQLQRDLQLTVRERLVNKSGSLVETALV